MQVGLTRWSGSDVWEDDGRQDWWLGRLVGLLLVVELLFWARRLLGVWVHGGRAWLDGWLFS
jgi:hypothetical protein